MPVLKASEPLKIPTQDDYRSAALNWARRIESAARQGLAGKISESDLLELLYGRVYDANLEAWVLGRAKAGDLTPGPTYNDQVQARRLADYQREPWLGNFAADLKDGRYSPENEGEAGAMRRAQAYAKQARGGAGEAFVAALDPDEALAWVRNAHESCEDCIALAAKTWTAATLYEFPGEGHTECLFECECQLQIVRTGVFCFSRESLSES